MKRKTILFTIVTLLVSTNVIACDDEEVIVNSSSNSSVSEYSSSTSNSESSSEQPPIHEHTFEETWSKNEWSHWHKATCEHINLVKDLENHIDENKDGICDVCEYEDPNFKPEPEPEIDKYYLPSTITKKYGDELEAVIEYSYPDDLHGFIETQYMYDGLENYRSKDVNTYSYNEDFSELTLTEEEYIYLGEKEEYRARKLFYEFMDNNSFMMKIYDYNNDDEEYVYSYLQGSFCNELGQEVLYYSLQPTSEEGVYEIYSLYKNEYDKNGLALLEESYEGKCGEGQIPELEYFNIYRYHDDNQYTIESYYMGSGDLFERDGYTHGRHSYVEGIRYYDEQIYYEDGKLGNHNKFGYDSDFDLIYSFYGGLGEEKRITKNENKQITKYEYKYGSESTILSAQYDELSNLTSVFQSIEVDGHEEYTISSSYSYNEYHQLTNAQQEWSLDDFDPYTIDITYSEIQDDEMLSHFETYDSIIRSTSDNVLVEGIY